MKTKTLKMLPKTPAEITNGGIYSQRVRCGKSNCKCANGETHLAYYFFTRRNGKLTKIYVSKGQVKAFTEIADKSAFERQERRRTAKISDALLKSFRNTIEENQAIIKTLKEG